MHCVGRFKKISYLVRRGETFGQLNYSKSRIRKRFAKNKTFFSKFKKIVEGNSKKILDFSKFAKKDFTKFKNC